MGTKCDQKSQFMSLLQPKGYELPICLVIPNNMDLGLYVAYLQWKTP